MGIKMRELTEQEIDLVDNSRFDFMGSNQTSHLMAQRQRPHQPQPTARN
jgi:hypothetical protein